MYIHRIDRKGIRLIIFREKYWFQINARIIARQAKEQNYLIRNEPESGSTEESTLIQLIVSQRNTFMVLPRFVFSQSVILRNLSKLLLILCGKSSFSFQLISE